MNESVGNFIIVQPYFPRGVQRIITTGSNHYIGYVNETTILKYPHEPTPSHGLDVERALFQQLGKHPRFIEFKGNHEAGLLLEFAPNGSLESYIKAIVLTKQERIRLAKEIAEGVAHAHEKSVIICDIHVRNILLDSNLHVKLCDFQGRLLGPGGQILHDGGASENAESFMPRENEDSADQKTDMFALGSTIYHIMEGHRPFPELHPIDNESEFRCRYREGRFPALAADVGGNIVRNCWEGKYESVKEVLQDLTALEAHFQK